MDTYSQALQLARSGRFAQSAALLHSPSHGRRTSEVEVLDAEVLATIGNFRKSESLVLGVLRRSPTLAIRSDCEYVLGLCRWHSRDNLSAAVVHFQKAAALAHDQEYLYRLCWAQLNLFSALSETTGPTVTLPLLGALKLSSIRLGDPVTTAAVHIFVGQNEAKRGALRIADRHLSLGIDLLTDQNDNVWLNANAWNTRAAICIMSANIRDGIKAAETGLPFAKESGSMRIHQALLGNLGNLYYLDGRFEDACACFQESESIQKNATGALSIEALESLASVHMTRDALEDAAQLLGMATQAIERENNWFPYANRCCKLTIARLLLRTARYSEAAGHLDELLRIAEQLGDRPLMFSAFLLQAELSLRDQDELKAGEALRRSLEVWPYLNCYARAQYERQLAASFWEKRDFRMAECHSERAKRIYACLGHRPGLIELSRIGNSCDGAADPGEQSTPSSESNADLLHDVTSLFAQVDRPDIVAAGLVAILRQTNCTNGATAISRSSSGHISTLESWTPPNASAVDPEPIRVGLLGSHTVELLVNPRHDLRSVASLNSVRMLLTAVQSLDSARIDKEEQMTLWPMDDVPLDGGDAIIDGRLREVLAYARRVANTNVSVLISGESGTGKEILARAIHHYSQRSNRPFIPFNCTAVPRDMLESQMFGHRRGAFTGADRDYPGLIRAAKEGTLFLDEVGELGLDLQPKLLRFLESGEISPLGEPAPLTVNVRIVAATNRNLEELVQEGRFREDLFYRLNVVRLTIPPLRERRDEIPALVHHFTMRAAAEFNKGRIRVAEETMEHLLLHHWPGNVRELNNEIRRMVALADTDDVLEPSALSPAVRKAAKAATSANGDLSVSLQDKLAPTIARIEREMIRAALRVHKGRVEAAAQALGISRKGLYLKRQRLGL